MEIKINREIRNYTESMFFGVETLSWMCMLGAAPFIACGIVTYNGMTAEQFAWVWLKSKFIESVKVKFECDSNGILVLSFPIFDE